MLKVFLRATFLLAMLFSGFLVFSQPGDPGGDPDVPITGIEWLLLGGGLWGAKKIYDLRRRK